MKKRVVARIFIKDGSIEAFKKQALEITPKTLNEKGCVFYSYFQDLFSPGEFLCYEEYADQDALDIHFNSEYLKVFRAGIKSMQSKETVIDII